MTQIEITFLGTTAGIPTNKRNHASIYVRYQSQGEKALLWDCGEGTQRQIFSSGQNFMRIEHIFITHWHADHFAGLLGLMETMSLEKRKKALHIYAPEADKFLNQLLTLGYSTKDFPVEMHNVEYEGAEITTVLDETEFEIISIPVNHGVPAVAYGLMEKDRIKIDKVKAKKLGLPEQGLIFKKLKDAGEVEFKGKMIKLKDIASVEKGNKIIYSGDTKICKNIAKISENADLLIHDSTYFEDMGRNHASLNDIIEMADKAKVKKVILTHISRRYQDSEELNDMISGQKNFKIAKDFMKVVVK